MSGYDSARSVRRDLEAARRDIRGTGCAAGCTLHLLYSPVNPWSEPIATIVSQNLRSVGITVRMERVDEATFLERLSAREFDMALAFIYDYDDVPDGLLTYALTADGGLRANHTSFQSPSDLRMAMTRALTEEGNARSDALAEINRLFLKYQPFVTLSDYAVGSVSRYAPSVVGINTGGFVEVAQSAP